MFGALLLFEDEFIHVVAISYTALILTELTMVALTIRTWHPLMILAELLSILLYLLSLILLREFFGEDIFVLCSVFFVLCSVFFGLNWNADFIYFSDAEFIKSLDFVWKTAVITGVSCLPLYFIKFLRRRFSPPSYQKLQWDQIPRDMLFFSVNQKQKLDLKTPLLNPISQNRSDSSTASVIHRLCAVVRSQFIKYSDNRYQVSNTLGLSPEAGNLQNISRVNLV